MTEEVHIHTHGRTGHISLNRPKALHALTLDMCHAMSAALTGWADDAEVEADRHDVPDMQIAVRLRWKPGHDFGVLAGREVVVNDLADEIPRLVVVHQKGSGSGPKGRYCTRTATIRVQYRAGPSGPVRSTTTSLKNAENYVA